MRRTSLASRIVLATVSVALLAAVATAVVAFQLVRQVGVSQSRDVLRSTLQVVAATPEAERGALVRTLDREHPHGVSLLLVRPDGSTVPAGADTVPASAIRRVEQTGTVSERVASGGHTMLVEGRSLSSGQSIIASQDFSIVQAANHRLLERFGIAVALGVAVAVGVGILVARLVSRPLRRAAASARELAGGRRGVAAARRAPGDDETRIAEVADIEQALASLDTALALSEGRQHEFLLSVSHEIRTPLTAIRGYADALADGLVPQDAVPSIGRTLVTETSRLEAFTRDLLELARLEADDFAIRPESLDLVAVAVQSQNAWRAKADAAQVTVAVRAPAPVPVTTDPMRVRQLLDGLVENALRAAPAGSSITVTVEAAAAAEGGGSAGRSGAGASGGAGSVAGAQEPTRPGAAITVRDEGPGLAPGDSADAFERGVLHDRYRASRPVGTGLGLSIAARLVRRLGGTIEAAPGDGGGAVFRVLLPPDAT